MGHEDKIEGILEKSSVQRQRLWDQWQQYIDEMDAEMKEDARDPLCSAATQKVMALCFHISGQLHRESTVSLTEFLRDYRVKELKDSYNPTWKQIVPLIIQLAGSIAGCLVAVVPPAITGATGVQAQSWNKISDGINGFVVQGASGVGHITNSMQQGLQAERSAESQADQRQQSNQDHARQQQLQAHQRQEEDTRRREQQKHETMVRILGG